MALVQSVFAFLWQRFLILGWIGRAAAVVVTLYGTGWIIGNLGLHGMARQLGSAAKFVLALLLTWGVIRLIWGLSRKPGR